jgi:hypothetical protein
MEKTFGEPAITRMGNVEEAERGLTCLKDFPCRFDDVRIYSSYSWAL